MAMANTLVRIYNSFSNAQRAREALLGSGFSPASVHLDSTADEAGPVDGNFILEYKDMDYGKADDDSVLDSTFSRDDPNEGLGRSDVVWCGTYMLMVDADDDQQFSLASDIAKRFGAVDVDELTSGARQTPPMRR
jgi:hypothetical protein